MRFDFTTEKLQPIHFPSREGIRLYMDHRSLRKVVYAHPKELGLSELGSRIPCPVQPDPVNHHQRTTCWAITNRNIREAVVKIFEFTTFENPRIITFEFYPFGSSKSKVTGFVDIVTGDCAFFQIGGKQNGKLWSLMNFGRKYLKTMLEDPNIKKITDISDYSF